MHPRQDGLQSLSVRRLVVGLVLLAACNHTDAESYSPARLGPRTGDASIQLTYSPDQDYWPQWTEDGQGILYAFVDQGGDVHHRCMGLLPAAGGTRSWSACDNRTGQADTSTSFGAYALGAGGRLLYTEAISDQHTSGVDRIDLWLADSAAPFKRTRLATFPLFVAGTRISWLTDLQWTGPSSFIALGQDLAIDTPAHPCNFELDTLFYDSGVVVTGDIAAGGVTLHLVDGTAGATAYSTAEGGQSIVYSTLNDHRLFRVPIGGGTAIPTGSVLDGSGHILGVACKGDTCLAAIDQVTLVSDGCPGPSGTLRAIVSILVTDSTVQQLSTAGDIVSSLRISPTTGDVVAQVGGDPGHLQTYKSASNGNLYIYRALVP